MNEQKVQTLLNNSLEIFKQGQEMEIQVLTTGICFCEEHRKMSKTLQILKPLLGNCHLEMKRWQQITLRLTVFRETKRNETKQNEMIKKILHKQKGMMALRIIPGLSSKTVLARWRQIILLDKVNTAL